MYQDNFNSSCHYNSINTQNNKNFTCTHTIDTPKSRTKCNGICFLADFYQQTSYTYPSAYSCSHSSNIISGNHFKPSMTAQPWSCMPLIYNSSFNKHSYFKKSKKKQTMFNPSSYRVTVRRITAPHIAAVAAEAYRMHKNNVSNTTHYEQLNHTLMSNHEQCRPINPTKKYAQDYFNSNNENIPSVPFKKILNINNGIYGSSTSLIISNDDQVMTL
ncbi:unnamed protein product [Rotaria sp. Silwood1]|nr:unnamed protein product [Rotaria sp. Silwood1]